MRDDRAGGYLISAIVFSAITALWAWIVRDDPYYSMTQLLGLQLPIATVFYLTIIPLLGFGFGQWHYQANGAPGAGMWIAKVAARSFHFMYSHILIVMFTLAMAADHFWGLNMDSAVRGIDDSIFDIASRFAPWLSAYLAGYNLGRVRVAGDPAQEIHMPEEREDICTLSDDDGELIAPDSSEESRHDRVLVESPDAREPQSKNVVSDLDPSAQSPRPRFSRLR